MVADAVSRPLRCQMSEQKDSFAEVRSWLDSIKWESDAESFGNKLRLIIGVESLEDLRYLTDAHLVDCGVVQPIKRIKFLAHVNELMASLEPKETSEDGDGDVAQFKTDAQADGGDSAPRHEADEESQSGSDLPERNEGPFGGCGGTPFDDKDFAAGRQIKQIIIRHGDAEHFGETYHVIHSIRVVYFGDEEQPPAHGGDGGTEKYFDLAEGEGIVAVFVRYGGLVDALQFVTDTGRWSELYGGTGGTGHQVAFDGGKHLSYISGRCGGLVDQITFHAS